MSTIIGLESKSDQDWDKDLLGGANQDPINRRLGIPVGAPFKTHGASMSFLRCTNNGWLQLVDMDMIQQQGQRAPMLVKIYRLTDAGLARLREITEKEKIDGLVKQ